VDYKKALVVEDNLDLRRLLCLAFKLEEVDTISFGSVNEALEYLEGCGSEVPGFAIIDYSLGEKTGAELIGALRSQPQSQQMKVILISGWQEAARLAKEMGADAFLRKPFDFDELFGVVRGLGAPIARAPHSRSQSHS
jgi:DNA-binding response OmpR family regulator